MTDVLIYAYLKKHYNNITKDSFPSFQCLADESGISKPTVMKCVDRLRQAGYITITRIRKVNHYTFSAYLLDTVPFQLFGHLDSPVLTEALIHQYQVVFLAPHF